jgi:hypothetical protein
MTNWEKLKWAGHNFYPLIICFFYILVATAAFGDAFWRAYHHDWHQCGKDLAVTAICLIATPLIWKVFKWHDALFQKWIDKGPKT